jgi:hypothetical protein
MDKKFKRYLVSYRHDGGEWNIELPATCPDDARRRLGQLTFGRLEGEIVSKVPSALGPFAALATFIQNVRHRRVGDSL